ncbi:MAG: tRNA 2-thiouridine(34) synthase MnmA [Anaerolineae bacterium]|jgi:tRNA-specific 2-thiouridylase
MADRERVIVAMSGGVDSSVAAALMLEQGYAVTGVMLHLWSEPGRGVSNRCCAPQAVKDARRVARALQIPFHVLDCARRFKESVVDLFVDEYRRGRTPNPCVACNKHLKFGYLLEMAKIAGASCLVTGHYARLRRTNGTCHLACASDRHKDQSYFLYTLGQEQLRHIHFPLGEYTKAQVRRMAEIRDLPVARREESQDICFVRDQDYGRFLRAYAPEVLDRGPILDREGQRLGEHEGLPLYTIGQRRGIGISWSEPLYVLEKRVADNALIVGPSSQLGRRRFQVESPSFVVGHRPALPAEVGLKIRSTGSQERALLSSGREGRLQVELEHPLRDVTPGQAAVFYQGSDVLGGGIISST